MVVKHSDKSLQLCSPLLSDCKDKSSSHKENLRELIFMLSFLKMIAGSNQIRCLRSSFWIFLDIFEYRDSFQIQIMTTRTIFKFYRYFLNIPIVLTVSWFLLNCLLIVLLKQEYFKGFFQGTKTKFSLY